MAETTMTGYVRYSLNIHQKTEGYIVISAEYLQEYRLYRQVCDN